jgi:hypothetical protein
LTVFATAFGLLGFFPALETYFFLAVDLAVDFFDAFLGEDFEGCTARATPAAIINMTQNVIQP